MTDVNPTINEQNRLLLLTESGKYEKKFLTKGQRKHKFPDPLELHRYITKDNLEFCIRDRGFIKDWNDSWWRAYELAIQHWSKVTGIPKEEAEKLKTRYESIYKKYIWRFIHENVSRPHLQKTWLPPVENPYQRFFGLCWCGCGRRCMWRCWDCNDFFANNICGTRKTRWNGSTYHVAWYQRCDRCIPEEDLCFCGCGNIADYICSKCKKEFWTNCGHVRYGNGLGSIYRKEDIFFKTTSSKFWGDDGKSNKISECSACNPSASRSVCALDQQSECLGFVCTDLTDAARHKQSLEPPICNCRNSWKTDMSID